MAQQEKRHKETVDGDGHFECMWKSFSTSASLSRNLTLVCRHGDAKTVEHFMLIVDADVFFTDNAFWTGCFTLLCETLVFFQNSTFLEFQCMQLLRDSLLSPVVLESR